MRRPTDPPELQRQQDPKGIARGDQHTARHAAVADDPVEIDPDKIDDEQEQFAELGVQALRRQTEFPDIGGRGGSGQQGHLAVTG